MSKPLLQWEMPPGTVTRYALQAERDGFSYTLLFDGGGKFNSLHIEYYDHDREDFVGVLFFLTPEPVEKLKEKAESHALIMRCLLDNIPVPSERE